MIENEVSERHQQNRAAWNEAAARYEREIEEDVAFLRAGGKNLMAPELDGAADLVYTGRGALCWILDIAAWARTVARLLKPAGRLYVFEGHPLDWVWDPNATNLRPDPEPPFGNYFSDAVAVNQGWPETYIPAEAVPPKEEQARKHERQWTLGQIMNALVDADLLLERFEEHPDLFWDSFPLLPKDLTDRLPHTFSLLMRKP